MAKVILLYTANILIAGWIGIGSFLFPSYTSESLYRNLFASLRSVRIYGLLWLLIAFLSIAGVWYPATFLPLIPLQLVFLLFGIVFFTLAGRARRTLPSGLVFFLVLWAVLLVLVFPWQDYL